MVGRPAVNCAIAGLEGNDLVIIDVCGGRLNIIPRITSPAGKGPRITWIGTTYTVSRQLNVSVMHVMNVVPDDTRHESEKWRVIDAHGAF